MDNQIKIDLIMFNMSSYTEWQKGTNNRNYQLLKNFQENDKINKILAVDYLPFTFKRSLRNYRENLLDNIASGKIIKRGLLYKLTQVNEKLYVYSTVKSVISPNQVLKDLKKIVKKLEMENIINWSCFPVWIDYYHKFSEKLTVFDAVDNWAEHPSYQKIKNKILDNYQKIAKDVDLIFTVSEEVQKVFSERQKIIWVPNGVDFSHYQKKYNLINRDIGDLKKPILGYHGIIQDKLDLELLKNISKNFNDLSIALIGPVWYKNITKDLKDCQNIYLLGPKPYSELPMYIQKFDVAIIPHRVDKFLISTNPMKLYEYLACGKPVVTNYQKELEDFVPYIYLANNQEEFIDYVRKALQEDPRENLEKRQEIVKEQTWKKKVSIILDYIYKELGIKL